MESNWLKILKFKLIKYNIYHLKLVSQKTLVNRIIIKKWKAKLITARS